MLINKVVGIYLKGRKNNNQKPTPNYKKLLDKEDSIDKQILELAKKGELTIDVVWVKEEPNLLL